MLNGKLTPLPSHLTGRWLSYEVIAAMAGKQNPTITTRNQITGKQGSLTSGEYVETELGLIVNAFETNGA